MRGFQNNDDSRQQLNLNTHNKQSAQAARRGPHSFAWLETGWNTCLALSILVLAALLAVYHLRIITASIPLDYYEGQMLVITGIIADGNNPYTRPFQPQAMDVYPPLYNILVAPFTQWFGNTLELHRWISGGLILLSVALCSLAAFRATGSRLYSAAAGVMIYAALLFYSTPVASTNALGILLYLSILLVPWLLNFSRGSLVAALVFGVLVFYTKQYFIAAMAMLCLYLFLYRCKVTAVALGACYALVLLGSLTIVHLTSPYYLDNTLFAAGISIYMLLSADTLIRQIEHYALTYWPLLLIVVVAAVQVVFTPALQSLPRRLRPYLSLAPLHWRGPLLQKAPDYFAFCLLWATIVTFSTMGRNPGNFMTYLLQLMSPFLVLWSCSLMSGLRGRARLALPLVLPAFYQIHGILDKDFSTTEENWARVEQIIAGSEDIYASQMLLNLVIKHDKRVYQDGHTHYFPIALHKPAIFVKENPEEQVAAVWDDYMTEIFSKVQNKEFDVILVNPWDFKGMFGRNRPPFEDVDGRAFLRRYYQVEERFPLSMTERHGGGTYEMRVWRPRP